MEQKFKVWCKKEKRWITEEILLGPEGKIFSIDKIYGHIEEIDPGEVEVLFSTGKHDKNGKEIFWGDIVKTKSPFKDDDVDYFGEIVYRNDWTAFGCFHIDPSPLAKDGEKIWTSCGDFREVEIIGNRFENEELLK